MFFGLLLTAVSAASAACISANDGCTEWIRPAGQPSRLVVYRTHSLEKRNERITGAFVFVHGINRDADNHFRTALAAAFLANSLNNILIVVPRFASNTTAVGSGAGACTDSLSIDEANWLCEAQRPDTWRSGGVEVGPIS